MLEHDLITHLTQQSQRAQHCHVLVDPLSMPQTSDHALLPHLREALGDEAITRIYRADLAHAPHTWPVLVRLSSPGHPCPAALMEWTVRAGLQDLSRRKRQVCGWLFSDAPASTLGPHIASLSQLPTLAERYCPIHEPIRMEILLGILATPPELEIWPIHTWTIIGSGGGFFSLIGEPGSAAKLPVLVREMLDDAGLVDSVLAAYRTLYKRPSALPLMPASDIAASYAVRHLRSARCLGLVDQDDLICFALHHLCIHPSLYTHSEIAKVISMTVQDGRPLASRFAQYHDATWRRMCASLPPRESYR